MLTLAALQKYTHMLSLCVWLNSIDIFNSVKASLKMSRFTICVIINNQRTVMQVKRSPMIRPHISALFSKTFLVHLTCFWFLHMLKENILANQCNLMMWATTEASKEQRALKNNGEMRERTKSNVLYNKGRYFYPKKFFRGYGYIFVSQLTIIQNI